jgi:hypothetical protein
MGPMIGPGTQAGCFGFWGYRAVTEGYSENEFGIFGPGNLFWILPHKGRWRSGKNGGR